MKLSSELGPLFGHLRAQGSNRLGKLHVKSRLEGGQVALGGEHVFGAGDLDFDGTHDGARLRRCNAGFFQNLERFRLHRHPMINPA